MIVRRAAEKDIGRMNDLLMQVNRIHHEGRPDIFNLGNKYTDEELKDLLKDQSYIILAACDEKDEMQGYAFCIIRQILNDNMRTDIKTLYIDDLCVDEKCRGQHIGSLLFEACKKEARAIDCYNLTLNVWALNPAAEAFYQRMGMQVLKKEMETIL